MSRVRPSGSARQNLNQSNRRTAVAYSSEGGGCSSFYAMTPLIVLVLGAILALLVNSIPASAPSPKSNESATVQILAPLFSAEVQYWKTAVLRWSAGTGLDPNLVATIMQIESCGDPFARSSAGAIGLFQVMPYHFDPSDNPFDPDTNALRGLTYLSRVFELAKRDPAWAFAAYNGGPAQIGLGPWAWPAETIRYVYWGTGIYADALQGRSSSQRLGQWLVTGGAALCQSAHQRLGLP